MKRSLYILIILFAMSCRKPFNKNELINMLRSNNLDSIVKGIEGVKAQNEISMIPYLLENTDDTRVLLKTKYYGKSIYQLKMETIEKISGIESPVTIRYKPDSAVISFYRKHFIRN